MPAVSNSSPLINLAVVGRLGLLQQQFQQVLVPTAVIRELKLSESYPGNGEISRALEAGFWISKDLETRILADVDDEPT